MPGHVGHTARPVELAVQDVVHHAARVADLEAARLDAAHRGGPDDGDLLGVRQLDQLPRQVLRDALRNDRDGFDLGILHALHRAVVG